MHDSATNYNYKPERQPHPPGWKPPKGPYNPYDPSDQRPPQGYPSEYMTTGVARGWTSIPKDASTFKVVQEKMKKLSYTPRPLSSIYPGQFKVLKRDNTHKQYHKGSKIASVMFVVSITGYLAFFYKWNDGYENVFSKFYRFRLRVKSLFVPLTVAEKEDLLVKMPPEHERVGNVSTAPLKDIEHAEANKLYERPQRRHLALAEYISQERQDAYLNAVKVAEETLEKRKRRKWFYWF